jgi:hypothetical protein
MKRYSIKDDDTTHLTGDQEGFEENKPPPVAQIIICPDK